MKPIILCLILLTTVFPCLARRAPYIDSLAEADAIAVVTVTASEQSFTGGLIHESATLTVDIAVRGIEQGTAFKISFGVAQEPPKYVDGVYSQTTTSISDADSFQIAERYLVLLQREKGEWRVSRSSPIRDDKICDGYFSEFAGLDEVQISKAIDILKARKEPREPNQTLQRNDYGCHGLCMRTLRASHGRG